MQTLSLQDLTAEIATLKHKVELQQEMIKVLEKAMLARDKTQKGIVESMLDILTLIERGKSA